MCIMHLVKCIQYYYVKLSTGVLLRCYNVKSYEIMETSGPILLWVEGYTS